MASIRPSMNISNISPSREWLDSSGRFLFGKYKGDLAHDIAQEDPSYLKWIIDTVEDIDEQDRELLSALIQQRARK